MNHNTPSQRFNFSAYDLFILAITGLSLLALLVITLPVFDTSAKQVAFSLDTFLSLLFLIDFFYILLNSPNKRAYLKWGWIDFLGSLPYLPLFRTLRIFRAIRSIQILRQNSYRDIWRVINKRPERTTLFSFSVLSILFISISSYAILLIESQSPDSNIQTVSEAFWWAIVTITTVGYGDYYPTTNSGRIIALGLMLVGIGIFSAFTSYLSTSFINRRNQELENQNVDTTEQLARIEQQLQELAKAVNDIKKDHSE